MDVAKKKEPTTEMISQVFALMGRRGGPARAKALTAKRRSAIAKKAAAARWGKNGK
jgi:phage gp16-like protein